MDWSSLPDHILVRVLEAVGEHGAALGVARTCKRWLAAFASPLYWRKARFTFTSGKAPASTGPN